MGEFIEMVYNLSMENRERAKEKQREKEMRESQLEEFKEKILKAAKNGKFSIDLKEWSNNFDVEQLRNEGFNITWDERGRAKVSWGGYKDK